MSNYPVSGMYTKFYDNSRTVFYDVNTVVINILEGKYNDNKIFAQIYTQNFFFLLYFHTKISTESNYVQPTINTMHFQKRTVYFLLGHDGCGYTLDILCVMAVRDLEVNLKSSREISVWMECCSPLMSQPCCSAPGGVSCSAASVGPSVFP